LQDADLAALCERAYPRLVGALALRTGDAALAEDLAQQALVRLCEHWPRVKDLDSPIGWAYRVGTNLAASWYRRRGAERRAQRRLELVATITSPPDELSLSRELREAVLGLPDGQRDAVVLRYLLDLSTAQTAATLGISEESVRVRCHRARATLREQLRFEFDPVEEVVGDVQ
jgi:RNA polymerase sigma-70 factor (ECF subfamily)